MTVFARLYIVRHGETDSNRNQIVQGHLDTELNGLGLAQAARTAEALKDVPFEWAYSSDLQRASKTAEAILAFHPQVTIEKQEALRERYMGEAQGERVPVSKPAPSLEQGGAMLKRVAEWWDQVIVKHLSSEASHVTPDTPCHNILITTHGGFIGTLIRNLLVQKTVHCAEGVTIGTCLNASITVIEFTFVRRNSHSTVDGTIVKFSDVAHLEGLDFTEINVDEE